MYASKQLIKLLIEQLVSISLVESDFLAFFKLLCSIHVNVFIRIWTANFHVKVFILKVLVISAIHLIA
jgi:hypothetical protein